MKKIELENEDIYVGNAREICSLYKNFIKKGIAEPKMQVLAGDTALAIICGL